MKFSFTKKNIIIITIIIIVIILAITLPLVLIKSNENGNGNRNAQNSSLALYTPPPTLPPIATIYQPPSSSISLTVPIQEFELIDQFFMAKSFYCLPSPLSFDSRIIKPTSQTLTISAGYLDCTILYVPLDVTMSTQIKYAWIIDDNVQKPEIDIPLLTRFNKNYIILSFPEFKTTQFRNGNNIGLFFRGYNTRVLNIKLLKAAEFTATLE